MNKKEVLKGVQELVVEGKLQKEEVLGFFDNDTALSASEPSQKHTDLSWILYYIGAAIVVAGIGIYVSQFWNVLADWMRIFVTFGFGLIAYVVGVLLLQKEKTQKVSGAFHLLAALLLPLGMFVFAHSVLGEVTLQMGVVIYLILTAGYLVSLAVFRHQIFLFFSIIFATFLFFSTLYLLASSGVLTMRETDRLSLYGAFLTGISYLFLGFFFKEKCYRFLRGFLYGFGSLGVLGSALALGGWAPQQYLFWEVVYPFLAAGALLLSVQLKSRAFLVFGALFLFAYIFKMTSEYFSNSLGWPISLMILGFVLIALGYLVFSLSQKFKKRA